MSELGNKISASMAEKTRKYIAWRRAGWSPSIAFRRAGISDGEKPLFRRFSPDVKADLESYNDRCKEKQRGVYTRGF